MTLKQSQNSPDETEAETSAQAVLFVCVCVCVVTSHHALLGRHQAVPLALRRYAAELLHFVVLGFSVEQAVQGQLRRAVGFRALLFLPRQVVLTHGIVPVNHRGERRRGLLGRHDSAAGRGQKRDRGQEE